MQSLDPVWIPIAGIALPVVLVPIILGLKYARFERQLQHTERIKALELGRTLKDPESEWSPGHVAVSIGVGVPVGVFFCAWMAGNSIGFRPEVWEASAAVGIAAVICGTVLAHKSFNRPYLSGTLENAKPPVDAEAFDVVGRRG